MRAPPLDRPLGALELRRGDSVGEPAAPGTGAREPPETVNVPPARSRTIKYRAPAVSAILSTAPRPEIRPGTQGTRQPHERPAPAGRTTHTSPLNVSHLRLPLPVPSYGCHLRHRDPNLHARTPSKAA
ncbi:hypothetical protein GCM10010271_62640 [Streptomyces kurssanovii]|nr:hypothetical protein GCM10010271_62640 [Streptomyces kurssanovii]